MVLVYVYIVVSAALCLWWVKETASALAVQSYLLLFVFLPECFSAPKVRVRSPFVLLFVSINIVLVCYFDVSYIMYCCLAYITVIT